MGFSCRDAFRRQKGQQNRLNYPQVDHASPRQPLWIPISPSRRGSPQTGWAELDYHRSTPHGADGMVLEKIAPEWATEVL